MAKKVISVLGVAVVLSCLAVSTAGASGGGGCPPPITNGSATRAVIKNWCYSPTVLHIEPGTTITWVNRDPVPHTITGANRAWGSYKQVRRDRAMTFRFNRAGVYPYYCVIHVGMVGTVVVRDGQVPPTHTGAEAQKAVTRVHLTPSSTTEQPVAAAVMPHAREPNLRPALALTAGLMAVLGLTTGVVRRRAARAVKH
jgi:plastocyanin